MKRDRNGFAALEGLLALIIIVFAVVTYLLVLNLHKATNDKPSTKPPASTKDTLTGTYAGWKSYCSTYSNLCLNYPKNWKLVTHMYSQDQGVSPEVNTITSPSGNVAVDYTPNDGNTASSQREIISVIKVGPTQSPGLKVVSLVDYYNGVGLTDSPYSAEDFVTNNLFAASGDKFTPGATITSDNEPIFHEFTPSNNHKLTSNLSILFDQKDNSQTAGGLHPDEQGALSELNTSEAATAHLILESAHYKT